MQATELFKNAPLHTFSGNMPSQILGLSPDSRHIQPGWLFFAIDGQKQRGADFIEAAQSNGAVAVVAETDLKTTLPVVRVQHIREMLAVCAANFYRSPSKHFYLNGITGTNGKTTTAYILQKIWSDKRVGLLGTIETLYPGYRAASTLTTQGSVELQKSFAAMQDANVSHVTMEVSSHAIEQNRTFACDFDSAIFTNLTQDHLDYHVTLDDYFHCKQNLFLRDLRNSSKASKAAIINVDTSFGKTLAAAVQKINMPILTYSLSDHNADFVCKKFASSLLGTEFQIATHDESHAGHTNLFGAHNVENLLGALAAGCHSGVDLKTAIEHTQAVTIPGRLEKIGSKNTFVDYAHTPDALQRILSTLRTLKPKDSKLIVVFGCGGNRDKSKRPLMGEIAANLADVTIVTSDNPRDENPQVIMKEIEAGIKTKHENVFFEEDRSKAIQMAIEMQRHDDVVLVAGKGHETAQIVGTQTFDFDDRKVLLKFL